MNPNTQPQNQPIQTQLSPSPLVDPTQLATRWWPTEEDPGYTLTLVSTVLFALTGPLVSVVPLFLARKKSRDAGFNNKLVNLLFILDVISLVFIAIIGIIALIAILMGAE